MNILRIERPFLYFFTRKREIEVPRRWKELQPHQFEAAARIYSGQITEDWFLALFYRMALSDVVSLDDYQRFKLLEMVEFIRDPRESCNRFLLKRYKRYIAPATGLQDVSFERFMFIDSFFADYLDTPTPETLAKFFVITYLPKGETVASIDIDKHIARVMRTVPTYVQEAAVLNWVMVKNWLGRAFKSLFGGDVPQQSTKPEKTTRGKKTNWAQIFRQFVGDAVHFQDTYKTMNCMDAMAYLNDRIKQANKR